MILHKDPDSNYRPRLQKRQWSWSRDEQPSQQQVTLDINVHRKGEK